MGAVINSDEVIEAAVELDSNTSKIIVESDEN
jgi:hypothetical protein